MNEKENLAATYSPTDEAAVPSARGRFTSVFGMGTGVAALLWPPGVRMGTRRACALLTLPEWKR